MVVRLEALISGMAWRGRRRRRRGLEVLALLRVAVAEDDGVVYSQRQLQTTAIESVT